MSKYYKHEIDIVQIIADMTIRDKNFEADSWCEMDAEILISAGKMISRELKKKSKREKLNKAYLQKHYS